MHPSTEEYNAFIESLPSSDCRSPRWTAEIMCPKYAVSANSLEDFYNRFYKRDRYHERGPEYIAGLLASGREMLKTYDVVWISWFDSATGDIVAHYED